ncbi:hypothetical protein ACFX2A_008412 [Malus domestica]
MAEQSIPESSEIRLVGQLDLGQEALLLPRKNLKPKFQVFPVSASQQLQFLIPFKVSGKCVGQPLQLQSTPLPLFYFVEANPEVSNSMHTFIYMFFCLSGSNLMPNDQYNE